MSSSASAAASRRTRPASCCAASPSPGHDVTVVPDRGGAGVRRRPHLGGAVRQAGRHRRLARRSTRSRTCGSASTPTSSWSPRPPPTCWPRPPTGSPTTCSPTRCSPRAARWSSPPRCTPRCGSTRPPAPTSPPCASAAPSSSSPPRAGSPAPTPARAGCPSPLEIFDLCRDLLARGATRVGRARPGRAARRWSPPAGTREYLDPVRFLGNRSSGLQGYALARAAAARGAEVTLVAANVTLPDPAGVKVVHVSTTAELRDAVLSAAPSADAVVMAAAPGRLPADRGQRVEDQEVGRRLGAAARPHPEPRHPPRDLDRSAPGRAR